jgi:hypothetical protein
VQRDILRILEAALVFLTALEDVQKEIASPDDADDVARTVSRPSRKVLRAFAHTVYIPYARSIHRHII